MTNEKAITMKTSIAIFGGKLGRRLTVTAMAFLCGCGGGAAGLDAEAVTGNTSSACIAKQNVAGHDVVLMIGQSNMAGFGGYFVPAFDKTDARILQWGRADKAILASEPLEHPDPTDRRGRIGPGLSFGNAYIKTLPTNRGLILVPAAFGATSFSNNNWNPGDPLYNEAIRRTLLAVQSNPSGNCVAAILWNQGVSDVGQMSGTAYAAALDRMIVQMRKTIEERTGASNTPFVLGEFSPDWAGPIPSPDKQAILDAIRATPNRLKFTSVADATGLSSNNTQGLNAPLHFDAASQRVYGTRYHASMIKALSNGR